MLSACSLGALFTWIVIVGGQHVQGQAVVGKKVKADDKKDKKDDRPPDEENIPFAFPYDRDAKSQLKGAREYLDFKVVPWNRVCSLLQNILESRSDSFFNVEYKVGNKKEINRISVKTEANRIIAAFSPEGLQFYQQLYGQTASALLDDAIRANYDIPLLSDISQKYFHTKAGAEATILLGSLYLERGNYLEAAYAFERVLARPSVEELITPRTLFKACLAFKRSGDARHAELLKTTLIALDKATSHDGLTLSRRTYTFEQLKTEINRTLELIIPSSRVGEWSMRGGNPSRSGTIEGGPPFLDPIFRSTMFYQSDDEGNSWIKAELERLFARDRDPKAMKSLPLPAFFPVVTPDLVVFRTYSGVHAVASRDQIVGQRVIHAGELRWRSSTSSSAHELMTTDPAEPNMKDEVKGYWTKYTQTGVTSILYENPLLGSLAQDGQNVYFVDDLAIPPPPSFVDYEFGMNPLPPKSSGQLADSIRAGRLAAVSLRTGMVVWELGKVKEHAPDPNMPPPPPLPNILNEEEADKTTNAFQLCLDAVFLTAPLPLNGKLFVLIEQAGVIRLLCLDPKVLVPVAGRPHVKVPTLLWTQKLGRPNTIIGQDSVRRYQGATLAAGDGIIICPTNSGAIVAVDVMSHSLLWAYAYRRIESDKPRQNIQFTPDGRPIPPTQLEKERWRASGPIISGGRVILTAYDSNKLECLDLRTGKVLWSLPRDSSDLYVGGIVNNKVVVVGKNSVRAYYLTGEDAETQRPKTAFDAVTINTPTGHGVGGRGVFYIPVRQDNAGTGTVPAAEIWAINVDNGQFVSKTAARKRNDNAELSKFGLGNLVFQDGMVFAQSAWELTCYPQLEQKKAEMDRLLQGNPKDPIGLLARGELFLDDGKLKEAIADFKDAEANNLPEEKRSQLREKKYIAYTELIRADFKEGEPFLDEYKRLCEIPAESSEGPEEKVLRLDEISRRQRLREFLLAKGRESQGRLGEAFDHYIALANMGEAKNLIEMPDEPNVRMRPDVWARGRIESMIRRSKDPAARKSLEERVQQGWEAVKSGNDLKRLREFVAVFGPYFAVGAEAQFLLSDKLLETNNEADVREAQTFLAQLRVTAEDPSVRARATEALARLMVKNQLMEDAVGLYMQLGKEYPSVIVRDGKTGAEFMINLLTDKRLLPYLEPGRYPMPTRVKAEQKDAAGMSNSAQFEFEPGGDLFPMYRRYRFTIDQFSSNNQYWTIKAYDRTTGVEKCKFPDLVPPQVNNPGSIPFSKFIHANGQLLLVQLGSWIYCLDLAEKKERWRTNLLGETPPGVNQNQQIQQPDADGEVVVRFDEGYIITLGKATVLQAGYAALLTRDGLEVVEPLSRRILWTRKGIPSRTQLYGDAQNLILVELDTYKKPVYVKVLRAVDGMSIEGSPNPEQSGRVLQMAKSFQIIGHNALLVEGTGDQPRVLRLYDLTTGKDVWRKEYDAKSIPIKSIGSDWTGFIKPNGEAEVIEVKTGKVAGKLKIDDKNLEADFKPCHHAQLFVDPDRFYLVLDREPGANSVNGSSRMQIYNNTIRTQPINGPLYAFDRTSGKRLWNYGDGLFENQMLIYEQFAELPAIIVAGPMNTSQNRQVVSIVVLEKARGRLIMERNIIYNNSYFQNINVNVKNGTVELNRFDLRIVISPDETPNP